MAKAKTSETNVQKIVRLEEEAEKDTSLFDQVGERIGRFAGTFWFVPIVTAFSAIWIAVNLGEGAFDPYPFHLLAGIIAFVALILTSFVLVRQERMSLRADRRNHLALQVNLLAEQEGTEIIKMLRRISRALDIEREVVDEGTDELASETSIEAIAEDISDTVDEDTGGKKGE